MKKYLAMLCALLMLTSFASCGDSQENSSELSDSVSELVTEEVTTEELTEPEQVTTVSFEEEFDIFDISRKSETITLKHRYYINYISMEMPMNSEHSKSLLQDDVFEKSDGSKITIRIEKNNDFDNNEDYLRSKMGKYGFDTVCKNNNGMILLMSSTYTNRKELEDENGIVYDYKKLLCKRDFAFFYNGYEFIISFSDDFSAGQAYKIINTLQLEDTFAEEATTTESSTITDEVVITTKATEPPTPAPTNPPTESPTNPPIVVKEESRTVYYTETGSRYHYDSKCGRGEYFPCTLDEALDMGLTPCKKCAS